MNKELAKSIGIAARAARKSLQLTQEDAAERIEVSVEFYARIERGTSLPSILTFARIVSALGVSADALLGRQPAMLMHPVAGWTAPTQQESPEIRRLSRRLRRARPGTLRLISLLLRELESSPLELEGAATGDDQVVTSATRMLEQEPASGMLPAGVEHRARPIEPFTVVAAAE